MTSRLNPQSRASHLLSAENGSIGEARSRAFLLDRFWVLDRSVDIHGADFLIQRRLTDRNLLERQRLGVVQVKYVQNGDTHITIPAEYIRDALGKPRPEFFLLVCTGIEDARRMFLLGAEEVMGSFAHKIDGAESDSFASPARVILDDDRWGFHSERLALDRIEHALANVGVADNYRYLSMLGFVRPEAEHIDRDLTLPIVNSYADLPAAFHSLKVRAADVYLDLEIVAEALGRMAGTTDPQEFLRLYESDVSAHVDGYGALSFRVGDLYDEDLFWAVRRVRDYQARLAECGLLQPLAELMALLDVRLRQLLKNLGSRKLRTIHVVADFEPRTMRECSVVVTHEKQACSAEGSEGANWSPEGSIVRMFALRDGHVEFCINAEGRFGSPSALLDCAAHELQSMVHEQFFGDDDHPL